MAAKLPPGGRIVNYDPQTYSSYPDSPQGVPDLNIIPGLPSVSGYASIVNGNYESTTHTHEQDDLDIGELSSGTLGRLDLREVVTVPEYFLVPLQAMPRSFDDFTQIPENFGTDPVLARGYGANFNDTAYPFDPGPAPSPPGRADGLLVLRGDASSPRPPPSCWSTRPAQGRPFASARCWRTGRPAGAQRSRCPPEPSTVTGHHPAGAAIGLSVQVVTGSLPSQRAVISVAGHPYELAGSLSSALVPGPWQVAGFSQGYAVFTLRKPAEPIVASTANGRRLPVQIVSSTTKSEDVRLTAPGPSAVIRSVAWDSGWTATVSVNGGKAQTIPVNDFDLVQAGPHSGRRRSGLVPLRPRHLLLASILSLGAIVLLLALLGVWLVRLRRRRRSAARCRGGLGVGGTGWLAGGDARTRGLSPVGRQQSRTFSRRGAPGSGGILRPRPPTSPRSRSRPRRARAPLVRG